MLALVCLALPVWGASKRECLVSCQSEIDDCAATCGDLYGVAAKSCRAAILKKCRRDGTEACRQLPTLRVLEVRSSAANPSTTEVLAELCTRVPFRYVSTDDFLMFQADGINRTPVSGEGCTYTDGLQAGACIQCRTAYDDLTDPFGEGTLVFDYNDAYEVRAPVPAHERGAPVTMTIESPLIIDGELGLTATICTDDRTTLSLGIGPGAFTFVQGFISSPAVDSCRQTTVPPRTCVPCLVLAGTRPFTETPARLEFRYPVGRVVTVEFTPIDTGL